ncbi:MAG: IMP cyclohydrolase, partial [Planctomycetota bacterium]
DPFHAYKLGILKALTNNPDYPARHVFSYETPIPGVGHCVSTYTGDGSPLPPFEGEPYMLELLDDADELAELYWNALNEDNKVSLVVKLIDAETEAAEIRIVNKQAL